MNFSSFSSCNLQSFSCMSLCGPQLQQYRHCSLYEQDYGIHHLYICINRGNILRHTGIAFQSINENVNEYQMVSKTGITQVLPLPRNQKGTTYLIYDTSGSTCGFRMYDGNGSDKDYEFILIGDIDLNTAVVNTLNHIDHSWYNIIFNNCRTYAKRTINILYQHHHINKHMIQQIKKILWNEIKQDYSHVGRIISTCYQTCRDIQDGNGKIAANRSIMIASEIVDVMKDVDEKMKW